MALRSFRYVGLDYPPEVGILLPGVSAVLHPKRMKDAEIGLLLDEFPHLRQHFDKGAFYDDGDPTTDDDPIKIDTSDDLDGKTVYIGDEELKYLLAELIIQMPNLTFL
jgi:hypothetical protein